jgi:hypothetical protein
MTHGMRAGRSISLDRIAGESPVCRAVHPFHGFDKDTTKLKKLLLVLVSTILSLVIVEVLTRLVLPAPGARTYDSDYIPGLLTPHPTRYYAYTPGFEGEVDTEEYHTDININNLGLRDDGVAEGETVDILAAGNSFTVGLGVQASDTWSSQLEYHINSTDLLSNRIRVLNAAVSGYSLTQIAFLIDELLVLEPKLVILGVYVAADLRRHDPYVYCGGHAVLSSVKPHLKPVDGGFLFSPYTNESLRSLHFWTMNHFYFGAHVLDGIHRLVGEPPESGDRKYSPEKKDISLLDELGAINEKLKARGIGLIVLMINHQGEDGTFSTRQKQYNAAVTAYCNQKDIPVFDPLPLLESRSRGRPVFRIGQDHHWSREAHALVGKQLGATMLNEDRIVELLKGPE